MSQVTMFGEVDAELLMEIKRTDGSVEYRRVANGDETIISKGEYDARQADPCYDRNQTSRIETLIAQAKEKK